MERLHMNYLRDLIHRLRAGEKERRVAFDLRISRTPCAVTTNWPSRRASCGLALRCPMIPRWRLHWAAPLPAGDAIHRRALRRHGEAAP
ncbi:MAG: hypothetical protein K6V36_00460 [Anaerolineae bacterium]|nr:hypothetical protein [Anaerolineae bacterium]